MPFEERFVKPLMKPPGSHHPARKRMNIKNNTSSRGGSGASSILVSLTDFVDFVSKSGRPKLTHVQGIKWRPAYDPATDFWRALREEIADYHRTNQTVKSRLDRVMNGITHPPKLKAYPAALKGYKSFLGKKLFQVMPAKRATWNYGSLNVQVNPELSATIQGVPHVIKLYFRAEPLAKKHAELILLLMADSLQGEVARGTVIGLLDVQRGKLYTTTVADTRLKPLLQGEASSFETMWNQIPSQRPMKIKKSDAA